MYVHIVTTEINKYLNIYTLVTNNGRTQWYYIIFRNLKLNIDLRHHFIL